MKLWGGRFTKETNELVHNFNASLSFDQKFYQQDIRGSKAHVTMLAKQGIITDTERDEIIKCLDEIIDDIVVLENIETKEKININKTKLPEDIHDGSIIIYEDNSYKIDKELELSREELIRRKLERVKNIDFNYLVISHSKKIISQQNH